jgi:4-hydroxybenzoate polyprenyltransferase
MLKPREFSTKSYQTGIVALILLTFAYLFARLYHWLPFLLGGLLLAILIVLHIRIKQIEKSDKILLGSPWIYAVGLACFAAMIFLIQAA